MLVYGVYIFEGLAGEKLDKDVLDKEDELTQKLCESEPMSTGIPFMKCVRAIEGVVPFRCANAHHRGEESALRNEWMEAVSPLLPTLCPPLIRP